MKKILLLVFLMFSIGFSNNTYKTTYDKSFKLSKKDETLNNSKIEKSLSKFFNAEELKNSFEDYSKFTDNMTDDAFESMDIFTNFIIVSSRGILKHTSYSISGINYLSPEKADVVLKITMPELNDSDDQDLFGSLMEEKFKKRTNRDLNDLDNISKQQEKEYFKIFLELMGEVFEEILTKNKTYNTFTKTVPIEKINNEWVVQENIFNLLD